MGLNYTAVDQSPQVTAERASLDRCHVAKLSDVLVGTIVVSPNFKNDHCKYLARPTVAIAHQFAVAPNQQGNGIGRQLLAIAESWAMDSGYSELALDTAGQATHLIQFYTQLGYERLDWVQWPGKGYRSIVLSKRIGVGAKH